MIIKRIARFVRAQDWNAIAVEFVIVAAGVLMGIEVSNWNEARVEKARVQQQVASLGSELQGNLATIERYERSVESQLADLIALERSFDQSGSTEAQTDSRLMNIFRVASMILETSAYDELTRTGSFRYVHPEIQSAVTEWKAKKGMVERLDQDALTHRISAIDSLSGTLAFERMVKTFAPTFEPAAAGPLRNDPGRLAKDAKVRNFLAMRFAIETQKLKLAKDLEGATEKLLSLVRDRG
jgi:hypothetical protein